MIKKINKYLLENHPLVWNTKLVWMLAILVSMHLVFFAMGYFSYFSPVDLHFNNLAESYFTSGLIWIGILLSILIFILWMNQYFKQNAFKLHYPKSNWSLYKEFLIIFLISLLAISQYLSYTKGLETRVAGLKSTEELEKEIDLTNRVAAFALQSDYYNNYSAVNYSHQNRCLDLPVFDSLVSRDEVLKLFVENRIKDGIWEHINPKIEDYKSYEDSLKQPLYTYAEYTSVLARNFPERSNISEAVASVNEESLPSVKSQYAPRLENGHILSSIYNFCGVAVQSSDSLKNGEFYAKETYQLLHENQQDKIQTLLNDYLKLADEYEVGYRFKDKKWMEYVYNPPYYFVDDELTNAFRYSEIHHKELAKDYIAQSDMENSLETIQNAKSGVIESFVYPIFLYIALGISLLIFTFRTTTMRTWVVSVVGSIVVFFIYFCLYFMFGMLFSTINETYALSLLLFFIALFFLLSFSGIFSGKRKLISGVNLIWGIWTFGALLPIGLGLYASYLEWKHPYNYQMPYFEHPHLIWMRENAELIMYFNLILIFIFLMLIIPIIKKWKAIPEE